MIEVGNYGDPIPGQPRAVMLHSTESGHFMGCDRAEFDRLAGSLRRGLLGPFLRGDVPSLPADGPPDQTGGEMLLGLHFDDADPVAACYVGRCGWTGHGDSVNDAVKAWTAHLTATHRGDWDQ